MVIKIWEDVSETRRRKRQELLFVSVFAATQYFQHTPYICLRMIKEAKVWEDDLKYIAFH